VHLEAYEDTVSGTLDDGGADDSAAIILEEAMAEAGLAVAVGAPDAPTAAPAARVDADDADAALQQIIDRVKKIRD